MQFKKADQRPVAFLSYLLSYFFYLWFNQESERMHWITLVTVPGIIGIVLKRVSSKKDVYILLSDFGFRKPSWQAMVLAILFSVLFFVIQLRFSRDSREIISILNSPGFFPLLVKALLLVLLTAGFTEEFFFRGIVQTSIGRICKVPLITVVVGSTIFSLYHVPYAYFNTRWPSHGDLYLVFTTAFSEAMVIGLILGFLYQYFGKSLWPCITLHSMINLLPVMKLLHND